MFKHQCSKGLHLVNFTLPSHRAIKLFLSQAIYVVMYSGQAKTKRVYAIKQNKIRKIALLFIPRSPQIGVKFQHNKNNKNIEIY